MMAQREPGFLDRVIAWLSAALFGPVAVPIPIRIERERTPRRPGAPR